MLPVRVLARAALVSDESSAGVGACLVWRYLDRARGGVRFFGLTFTPPPAGCSLHRRVARVARAVCAAAGRWSAQRQRLVARET